MIELMYFSNSEKEKKAYHLIQPRRGEPWQIVDGDEVIGSMEKSRGCWSLLCRGDIPDDMCAELARLIEAQHFNQLPQDIKTHWPGKVLEVVVKSDAEYLVICKPGTDLERFVKLFASYAPYLLRDEWPILFRVYNAEMSEDVQLSIQRQSR